MFAAAIPRGVRAPRTETASRYLRKDHVFLLERFFYFLEEKQEHGLLVFDESDKAEDRRFVRRLVDYFRKTQRGRTRTAWVVPVPLFVASDMSFAVQAADLAIYCINWGFRLPRAGMNAESRDEIVSRYRVFLDTLQYRGESSRDGETYRQFGNVFVRDPYTSRNPPEPSQPS